MSAEGGFEFRKFQPRTNVRTSVNRMLQEFLRETAPGASYKAIVADQGNGFWISLVVSIQGRYFNTEAFMEKKRATGLPRDWQIDEIARLLLDLRQQIRNFERACAVVPAPIRKDPNK